MYVCMYVCMYVSVCVYIYTEIEQFKRRNLIVQNILPTKINNPIVRLNCSISVTGEQKSGQTDNYLPQ